MEIFYSISINLIFYALVIELCIGIIFFFIEFAKRLLLNSIAMLLIVTPLFLRYNNLMHIVTIPLIAMIGLCIYPITLSIIIKHKYNQYQSASILPIYIVCIVSLIAFIAVPEKHNLIIYLLHILFYLYILYIIFPGKHELISVFLLGSIFLNFAYLSITVYFLNEIHFIISAGMMSIIITLLMAFNLRNRMSGILKQFNIINELNNKLNHRITRLKQSNDSCRKIISEKDLELSQMARHASLAELTTGIAHELAQPLTGIKGIAQNMIDDINSEEFENLQAVSELLRICALVDKSSSIIDHIRNFSKKSAFSLKQIDLNKVILEAIDLIHLQLKNKNIDLVFVLDDTIPKIFGDKISLEQLIVNIILNSKDAILEKEFDALDENGTIRITTSAADGMIMMIIQDNGSGISDEIKHKIWSPFFTTKKRDHGTGIGLSICSRILKDHKAVVDIQSDKMGTQFTIRFPVETGVAY
jgi:signal transduction histidine kinase